MEEYRNSDNIDLESLMLEKSFEELSKEERLLVLQNVDSQEEYQSMRAMLLNIIKINEERESLVPKSRIRKELLAKFRQKNQRNRSWWSGLIPFGPDFSPAKVIIPVVAILVIAFLLINPLLEKETFQGRMAENIVKSEQSTRINEQANENTTEQLTPENAVSAEIEDVTSDLDLDSSPVAEDITFGDTELKDDAALSAEKTVTLSNNTTENATSGASTNFNFNESDLYDSQDLAAKSLSGVKESNSKKEPDNFKTVNTTVPAADFTQLLSDLYTSY